MIRFYETLPNTMVELISNFLTDKLIHLNSFVNEHRRVFFILLYDQTDFAMNKKNMMKTTTTNKKLEHVSRMLQ